jgi:aryl-alcohol dehydrogenase-like predicted oxidoreductase
MQKLALGTANFGSHYGILNRSGKLSDEVVAKILKEASLSGIRTLDTASVYGDCHEVLGRVGTKGWEIISKIPAIPANCKDVTGFLTKNFENSLKNLQVDKLQGLLLHNSKDLLAKYGDEIFLYLKGLRSQQLVSKVGVSIYDPGCLSEITKRYEIDLVQGPVNIFDNQIHTSGWLERLANLGIEFHARSIFLQGVLLSPKIQANKYFSQWNNLFLEFNSWVRHSGVSALEKCVAHVRSFENISHIIVGVDNVEQICDLLAAVNHKPARAPSFTLHDFEALINPSRWKLT